MIAHDSAAPTTHAPAGAEAGHETAHVHELVARCGGDPNKLAQLLKTAPAAQHSAIVAEAHKLFGNAFVQRAMAEQGPREETKAPVKEDKHEAGAKALSTDRKAPIAEAARIPADGGGGSSDVKGGAQNVDLTAINRHQGFDANRLGTKGHKNFKTVHPTQMYQLDGTPEGFEVPVGAECEINAGAITKLVLRAAGAGAQAPDHHGHAVECVFIFNVLGHGGWMPTSSLPPAVLHEQLGIANAIERQRGDAHHHFGHGTKIRTGITAETEGVMDLYTYPHQTTVQNKAKYYFNNLALNLPYTGGARVGVLTANIPAEDPQFHGLDPYREFHAETPHREASIPL
ncbi:MAG TPA: hypothetical protein VF403_20075, partial [Kofleriaceae bacterium]